MNPQELLWKYAEGQCTGDEKAEMERLLVTDENLREELRIAVEVKSALAKMELEQPSLRFTQNVMEALPAKLYATPAAEPLLPTYLKFIFWSVVAGSIMFLAKWGLSNNTAHQPPPRYENIAETLQNAMGILSHELLTYAFFAMLTLTILAVIDRLLAKRNWQFR